MKTVLITGASGGIGQALCRYFENRDYKVLAHARSEQQAKSMAEGTAWMPVWGDLTEGPQVKALASQVIESGPLDMVVHNAGILSKSTELGPNGLGIQAEVNVVAPARLTKELASHLEKSDDPMVVIVSSTAANFARGFDYESLSNPDGSSLFGQYALSKSAANALTMTLATIYPAIRFVSTEPGFVKTKMTATNEHMPVVMKMMAKVMSSTPEKAAHRCFDHLMDKRLESGSVVQSGKVVDPAKKPWAKKEATSALEKLLARVDEALLHPDQKS